MSLRASVLLVAVVLAPPVLAITVDRPERILLVRHGAGRVDIEDAGRSITSRALEAKMSFTRRHDEVIRVVVDDPNPLIWEYKWEGVTKTDTDDFKAASDFAGTLGELAKAFKAFGPKVEETPQAAGIDQSGRPSVGSRAPAILDKLGIDREELEQFATDLDTLAGWAEKVKPLTTRSAGSRDDAQRVKDEVMAWPLETTAERVEKTVKTLRTARTKLFQELSANPKRNGNGDRSGQSPDTTGSTGSDVGGDSSTQSPDTEGSEGSSGRDAKTTKNQEKKEKEPKTEITVTPGAVTADQFDLTVSFLLAQLEAQDVPKVISGLRAFVKRAKGINERKVFDPIEYSATQNVTGKMTITPAEDAVKSDAEKRQTGTFEFVLQPYSPATLRNIAPAMIYSFVETHDYDTQEVEGGKFQIVRKDSGNAVNGLTLAAMLTLTPRRWSSPTVGGSFQIGISPVKDRIGIFGGATLNVFDLFSIGGGLAYQQTERLASGLSEGQSDLTSADQLKTTTKFEPGAYLSLTVKIK